MGDSNAWDMLEEPADRKKSTSPSGSRVEEHNGVSQMLKLDEAELQALGIDKEEIAEAAERHRTQRKSRSKSPALESLRKASMNVLQRIGALTRKKDTAHPFFRTPEILEVPLDTICKRPKEFFQEPKPFSFRDLGKVFVPPVDLRQEKCAYLFRGGSFEEEEHAEGRELTRLPEYDPFCPVHGSRRRFARRNLVTMQHLMTSVERDEAPEDVLYKVLYLSLAISSLFVPSYMINRLGCKLTLITAMGIFVFYMAVNIRPSYPSLIPASILAGMAGSCIWGAKCVYITEMGIRYARLNFESQNTVIVRFFGYFFMIVHSGQVFGNLLSSFIMTAAMKTPEQLDEVYKTCGHGFPMNLSELTEKAAQNLERPNQRVYLSVCLTYLACAIVAVMIVSMFLNALHKDVVNRSKAPVFHAETLKQTVMNFKNTRIMLLVPLTVFNGVEQAFVVGIFTKAFIACGLGVSQIGFVCTAFGVADAICSLVFGPLIKLFGRMPLFVFGAVNNMLMIVTLMIWPLNPADKAILYVAISVWGMADAVWNTQINGSHKWNPQRPLAQPFHIPGYWVALAGRESLEFAFTSYRFWESIGLALGFVMVRQFSVELVLLLSFCLLLLGMTGYCAIELYDDICVSFRKLVIMTADAVIRNWVDFGGNFRNFFVTY
ncbi:hypothetical protein OESDEN_07214 [Oesophagostomum dentatum]|uniref:Uncharacterized protein n=1 Tax=Oesophagostomum dentatum TaxID=61180 RepID=A0A0B1T9Q5_OESDE|nr:hypothetical protein OESDEN_07214 [Oesophagostomum dentatum]